VTQHIIEGTGEELIEVLHRKPKDRFRLIELAEDEGFVTFEAAVARATSRTTDEIAAARERLMQASPHPRELPDGMSLEDVLVGRWPGDESDEQIFEALQKLS
jgi:hypothetical protein